MVYSFNIKKSSENPHRLYSEKKQKQIGKKNGRQSVQKNKEQEKFEPKFKKKENTTQPETSFLTHTPFFWFFFCVCFYFSFWTWGFFSLSFSNALWKRFFLGFFLAFYTLVSARI
jgi:hypothetical protein